MPDGTKVQDRNIRGIPSIRRNTVLADFLPCSAIWSVPEAGWERLSVNNPADRPADPADRLNERHKQILRWMAAGREYNAAEISDVPRLKGSRTRELLNDLVRKSLLEVTAENNRRRYVKV